MPQFLADLLPSSTVIDLDLPSDEIIATVTIVHEMVAVIVTGHAKTLECYEGEDEAIEGVRYCRCNYHSNASPGYPLYVVNFIKTTPLEDKDGLVYELCKARATEFLLPPVIRGLPKITNSGIIYQMKDMEVDEVSYKIVHKYFRTQVWDSVKIPPGMFTIDTGIMD